MRSGVSSFRWVRPLKRILCLFDGAVVTFEAGGVASSDVTEGHRFMGAERAPFAVKNFADYAAKLHAHYVELDQRVRKQRILDGARAVCAAEGLELVEDEGLLEEVSGLSEWPTPILGRMDPDFLDLPPEVIRTSMRTHQKYFAVRPASSSAHSREGGNPDGSSTAVDPATGSPPARGGAELKLAPNFVVVANIEPADGGVVIAAGNAKVLSARLSDARFFWDEDRKTPLEDRLEKLKGVTFHAKLGTLYERVERIEALAREIAPLVGADPDLAAKAARLCKADLVTGMVGEFPELQGIIGGYYARAEGLEPEVADAVRDHYKPVGPSDTVPTAPVTVAVALADKLDTLVGFFAIDEKPTGSKDPFALRRAALGIMRTLLQNEVQLDLWEIAGRANEFHSEQPFRVATGGLAVTGSLGLGREINARNGVPAFFADRLKVLLRDEGKRHDLVDAVFALGDDDLVRITRRVEALSDFLATDDGANLLAGYKRATNILKAEVKKNPAEAELYRADPELSSAAAPEEAALVAALRTEQGRVDEALAAEDFTLAMQHLAHLRAPVDAFFDKVLVNHPDPVVRMNRIRLLTQVRDTANRVADFSLISG